MTWIGHDVAPSARTWKHVGLHHQESDHNIEPGTRVTIEVGFALKTTGGTGGWFMFSLTFAGRLLYRCFVQLLGAMHNSFSTDRREILRTP